MVRTFLAAGEDGSASGSRVVFGTSSTSSSVGTQAVSDTSPAETSPRPIYKRGV